MLIVLKQHYYTLIPSFMDGLQVIPHINDSLSHSGSF